MSRKTCLWAVVLLLIIACVPALAGLSPHEVLVVVNDQSSVSKAIGDYYRLSHGIPEVNVLHLTTCPTDETIGDPRLWYDHIWQPVLNYLNDPAHPWMKERIKAIALTKGIPVRFWAGDGRNASVDSPLCYLGSACTAGYTPTGVLAPGNPYCGRDEAFETYRSPSRIQATPPFPELHDIKGTVSGVFLASGDNGVLLRSTDGVNWTALNDSQRYFAGKPMIAIAIVGNTGWVAESNGRINRSVNNDNCLTWGIVQKEGSTLYSISFADVNNGWASGAQNGSPLLLHTTTGGWSGWSAVDISSLKLSSCELRGVSAVGADKVIASGTSGTVIKGEMIEGTWHWTKAAGIPNIACNSAALLPSGGSYTGWIVGDGGVILKTVDAGNTWQQQSSGVKLSLTRVFALDDKHAWAATGSNTLLKTIDGNTWQALRLPAGRNIRSVYFTSASNGFAVGGRSILTTTDGGATWNEVFSGQNEAWRMNYLVCRLDGYQTPADANGLPLDIKRMIDNACKPDSSGRFILDDKQQAGNDCGWLSSANDCLVAMKNSGASGIEDVKIDKTDLFLTDQKRVMGYASWGSNEPTSPAYTQYAKPRNSWQRGSVSTTYVSSSGRTFNYPPDYASPAIQQSSSPAPGGFLQVSGCWQGWKGVLHDNDTGLEATVTSNVCGFMDFQLSKAVSNGYLKILYPDGSEVTSARITTPKHSLTPGTRYSIRYQSLVADLIREGCDASIGNVWEPYLPACGQPQYLLPRYASGYTWAEAAYMSMSRGGWQEVAVGDPLMAAYATPPVVRISAPSADGSAQTGNVKVSASATPSGKAKGISRIEVWFTSGSRTDGRGNSVCELIHSAENAANADCSINTSKYPDGVYSIKVIAYDDSAQMCCGVGSRHIYIQNGGVPSTKVTITQPAKSGSSIRGKTTVKAGVSSPQVVSSVEFWMLTSTGSRLIGTSTIAEGLSVNFDSNYFTDGDCGIQTIARCANGKIAASDFRAVSIANR